MTTLATRGFEQYVAEQTATRGSVTFDEMIFANIPNLTAGNLVNHLQMPSNNQIVYRQTISQSGVVNENAVVYSVTMGTEVGNFDFNFIGLVNRSRNLLAVAVYTNTIKKVRNHNGVQGNSITRSILLEFTGAKQLTNINVSAETWQIDFTARLKGLDEKIRLTNRDLYGRAVFFEDGFKVTRGSGRQYFVEVGNGYIEGIRADNKTRQTLTVRNLPCSIYLDIVHHNTVTGAYQTDNTFLQTSKNDWVDNAHYQHYVQILADIDSNGVVTDRRILSPLLGITPKDLTEETINQKDHTGHTHRLPLASLIKKGIAKLYSGLDSNAEDMAATPRAIKRLKDLIDANIRNFGNFIANSKKSNAIDSPSSDTVATSYALKTAYDKAVDALNVANSKLGPIGTYTGNTSSLYGQNIIFDVRDNNNLGLPSEAYPWGVGLSLSSSNGGKALLYIAHNSSQVWAKGVYGTDDSQPWRRIDGTDWGTIRNPVYASTTLRGLAQYSDAINLDSSEFAASSKAVKLLNDKKVDKLIEQVVDLTRLDPNKWYPVVLKMHYMRKMHRFAIRRTLGDGNNPPWGTHGDGFTTYCEWETQSSGWGTYPYIDSMRLIRQFTFAYSHQSPLLKIGQIYQASWEYVYLRGGTSYTLSHEEGVIFEIGDNGYRWQSGSYSDYLPVIDNYDESLVPKTSRQAIKDSINDEMVGQVAYFASSTPPTGWLKANGAAVSRTTYAALFARIGTRFGAGDGSTTFNLPDLRGEFVRGWDDGRNIDAGRVFGSLQLGSAQVLNASNVMRSLGISNQDNSHASIWQRSQHDKIVSGQQGYQEIYGSYNDIFSWHGRNGHGRVKNGNNQIEFGATRPRNIALLACIKY